MARLGFPRKAVTDGTFFASESFMSHYSNTQPYEEDRFRHAACLGSYGRFKDTIESVVENKGLLQFRFERYKSHVDIEPILEPVARSILDLPAEGTLKDYIGAEVQVVTKKGNVRGFRPRP